LSTSPVACDTEGGSKKLNTIVMETKADITECYETGDKMFNPLLPELF
jgi:hypothetical protein